MSELRTSIVVTEQDVTDVARDHYDTPRRRAVVLIAAAIMLAAAVLAFTRDDTVLSLVLVALAVAVIAFWLLLRILGRRSLLSVMPIGSPIELVADAQGMTTITPIGTNMLRFTALSGFKRVGGAIHITFATGNTQDLPGRLLNDDDLATLENLRRAAAAAANAGESAEQRD